MANPLSQLTLGLSLSDEATFANFYAGKNEETVLEISKTASGSGERIIYLCGARGQGRSHLLQAACHKAHQHQLRSVYLSFEQRGQLTPDVLQGLEALSLVCLDDVHLIAGLPQWEEALFHLFNRLMDAGGRIILSANELPKALPFALQDLVSRLTWGIVFQLHPLADEEKLYVLKMRAERRGMDLPDEVGRFILTHCPRHMGTLLAAFDALDKTSLTLKRRLTIPFVKEVLDL
jgi:DnaA-homolog protein